MSRLRELYEEAAVASPTSSVFADRVLAWMEELTRRLDAEDAERRPIRVSVPVLEPGLSRDGRRDG